MRSSSLMHLLRDRKSSRELTVVIYLTMIIDIFLWFKQFLGIHVSFIKLLYRIKIIYYCASVSHMSFHLFTYCMCVCVFYTIHAYVRLRVILLELSVFTFRVCYKYLFERDEIEQQIHIIKSLKSVYIYILTWWYIICLRLRSESSETQKSEWKTIQQNKMYKEEDTFWKCYLFQELLKIDRKQ